MAKQFHIQAHPSQLNLKPVTTEMLLDLFPFGKELSCRGLSKCTNYVNHNHFWYAQNINRAPGMILNREMLIVAAGNNLIEAWSANNENKHPNILIGSPITQFFKLRRPTGIVFDFENVKSVSLHRSIIHTNSWFELSLGHDIASRLVWDSIAEIKRIRLWSRLWRFGNEQTYAWRSWWLWRLWKPRRAWVFQRWHCWSFTQRKDDIEGLAEHSIERRNEIFEGREYAGFPLQSIVSEKIIKNLSISWESLLESTTWTNFGKWDCF